MTLARAKPKRSETEDLASLWSGALAFTPHLEGCACMGLTHIALDRQTIEDDILDYLRTRYRASDRGALTAFVDSRMNATNAPPFDRWLRDIGNADLSMRDRKQLSNDLQQTLQSMNAPRASGFQCD